MKPVVILLGLVIIASCIYLIFEPRKIANTIKALVGNYQLRFLAFSIALFAVLFPISAPAIDPPWVLWTLGTLSAAEALVTFTNLRQMLRQMMV